MDRIALTLHRASVTRRKIYASLPFELRLSNFFVRLALDSIETLGRAIGAEFLLKGVTGMPDPGPRWDPKSRQPALTLPKDYMKQFASGVYGTLMRKIHDPDLAEEAIMTFLTRIVRTGEIREGVTRSAAESYVRDGVMKAALSLIKSRQKSRSDSLDEVDDEGITRELADPRAFQNMQRELSPQMWAEWMAFLARRVHVDIPLYISLSMEGYSDNEIIGYPRKGYPGMLPHYKATDSGPTSYMNKVKQIVEASKMFFRNKSDEEDMPGAV